MIAPNRSNRRAVDKAVRCIERTTKIPGRIVVRLGRDHLEQIEAATYRRMAERHADRA